MSEPCLATSATYLGAMPTLAWACGHRDHVAPDTALAEGGNDGFSRGVERRSTSMPTQAWAWHPTSHSRSPSAARSGFTLLEVLLVILLSALLMSVLWSLLSVYVGLFEKGESRTEHAQLVRSVMRQISDDLHAAIQDTAPRPPQTPATAPLRRFGLFGSSRSLQVDILRADPLEASYQPKEAVTLATTEAPPGPKAPDFRTIQYAFTAVAEDADADVPAGLIRRELDWEIPRSEPDGSDTVRTPARDETEMHVPEVVSLEFRYFDGQGWSSQWNSIQRKALPAAIEVRMQVEPPQSPSQRSLRDSKGTESRRESQVERPDEEDRPRIRVHEAAEHATSGASPKLPTHRFVVQLSVSPLQKPSRAEAESATTRPVVSAESLPSLSFPAAPLPRSLEEQPRGPATPGDQHLRGAGEVAP